MQYSEAVAEARQLVKRSEDDQWRLAQLTYEQVEAGTSRNQWAKDTGIARSHAQTLYRLWAEHGQRAGHQRPPFGEAYVAIHNPAKVEGAEEGGIWAQEYQERAKSRIRSLPPEQKAEVVREALDDQDVAVRVLRDPHTRRNVTEAREQVVNEIETAARDRTEADPTSRAIREATQVLTIESNISKARFWLAESARQIQELPERDTDTTERFRLAASEADTALGWLRTAIDGGQVTDEELIRLLEGGA